MKRKLVYLTAGLLVAALPSMALFGIGDIVVDVLQEFNSGQQLLNDIQMLTKMEQNVQTIKGQYEQMKTMATYLTNKSYWKTLAMTTVNSVTRNQVGETTGWQAAANTGLNSTNAWSTAAISLNRNPQLRLGTIQSATFANAEIGEGAGIQALAALGQSTAQQTQAQQAIDNCESATQRTDDAGNTTAAQQNIANACQAILLRQSQTGVALQQAQLNLQLAQSKPFIDSQTEFSNMLTGAQASMGTVVVPGAGQGRTITTAVDR